mmetsp:Transcript_5058/g.14982  ORF Transcript_5058/g.14982 Transcript_5058/m.14982 type:complete len:606 (+) Transcript_5058:138-1955(+)|eukprot:CAMPEP_0119295944 /NCGR_PEP_ID=MMETSP1329-20130426/50317_1 /TAXON_ID=114041 /ORGANISM="Genus nov. species nov., Strain RCC1024" /LENGTH=605 /DNA_ID=CAMNT_0007296867 /DNA_START=2952 /DNA_END=4769 /DNA_ORIENTATION=-
MIKTGSTKLVLHETLHGLHEEHGLSRGREEDFGRYRRYCTRQLRRVRKLLGLTCSTPKSLLLAPRFALEHIVIQVLIAERAWAHAAEIKMRTSQKSKTKSIGDNEEIREPNYTSQRRIRQRLLKATLCCETLSVLCVNVGDELLEHECSAYADWIKGLYLELKGDYMLAADALERARVIYVNIAKDQNVVHRQIIFQERAAACSTVVRRCKFTCSGINLPELDDKGIQSITESSDPTVDSQAAGTFVLSWCGFDIEISTAKVQQQLRTCKLGELDPKYIINMQSGGMAGLCLELRPFRISPVSPNEVQYAHKLLHLDDIVRTAHAEENSKSSQGVVHVLSTSSCIGTRDKHSLGLLEARISYEKLNLLYERCDAAVADRANAWRCTTLDFASACVSHFSQSCNKKRLSDDVFNLYEKLIEVTGEMHALIDIRQTQGEAFAEALGGRTAMLNAYRCHFLAETFGAHEEGKTFCLFHHAVYLSDYAFQEAEACEAQDLSQEMAHLSDASRTSMTRLKIARYLERKQSKDAQDQFQVALSNCPNIHVASVLAPCATLPFSITFPAMKQVDGAFCKPVLFNLAHAHLKLPLFRTRPYDGGRGLFGWFQR